MPTSYSTSNPEPNQETWAIGWGHTSEGGIRLSLSFYLNWNVSTHFSFCKTGSISNQLRNVKMTIYSSSDCNTVYPVAQKNWNAQICAGELAGGKDTCQGDSGGGLFVKDTVDGKSKFVAAGIVSYGVKSFLYE